MALTLESLQARINTVETSLNTEINKLSLHQVDAQTNLGGLQSQINSLNSEDVDLHSEIHTVAMEVDSNNTRIQALENNYNLKKNEVSDLAKVVNGNKDSLTSRLDQMDLEHHEELHALGIALDKQDTQLKAFAVKQGKIPDHIVMSEDEYEALTDPEPGVFYFTYEAEN